MKFPGGLTRSRNLGTLLHLPQTRRSRVAPELSNRFERNVAVFVYPQARPWVRRTAFLRVTTLTAKHTLRHFALGARSAAAAYAVFHGVGRDDSNLRSSMATASQCSVLLVATMAIGPVNVLRSPPNPVSTSPPDAAIRAETMSLVQLVVGLQVRLRGFMWQHSLVFPRSLDRAIPLGHDTFGVVPWIGPVAVAVLLFRLPLLNDLSLCRLGTKRWKGIHRWSYCDPPP